MQIRERKFMIEGKIILNSTCYKNIHIFITVNIIIFYKREKRSSIILESIERGKLFAIILDRFDECLVLLAAHLGWPLSDMVSNIIF